MKVSLKRLPDQVMVITGASSGIGLATARLASARGARLVLAARSEGALTLLARELRAAGGRVVIVVADVSNEADVERIDAAAHQAFGGYDTWVNNAAVSAYGFCRDVSIADMRRILDTNFWGTVYGSRIACRTLAAQGGALINVGSIVSDRAVPLQAAYSASKHAIKAWTDALRTELAYEDLPVAVTLIKPAAIATPYAEHAANYLPDQPTHTPPVYSPRAVAEAILYAAQHKVRDVVVGGSGKVLQFADAVVPHLTDRVMTHLLLPSTHSGEPRRGRPALYAPTEDLRERGDYPGLVRPSLYSAMRRHPRTSIAGAALIAGWWLLRRAPAPS